MICCNTGTDGTRVNMADITFATVQLSGNPSYFAVLPNPLQHRQLLSRSFDSREIQRELT